MIYEMMMKMYGRSRNLEKQTWEMSAEHGD